MQLAPGSPIALAKKHVMSLSTVYIHVVATFYSFTSPNCDRFVRSVKFSVCDYLQILICGRSIGAFLMLMTILTLYALYAFTNAHKKNLRPYCGLNSTCVTVV